MNESDVGEQAPDLLFVDLGTDSEFKKGKDYPVVPASSSEAGSKPFPQAAAYYLSVDLLRLNAGDLPDLTEDNEASLTIRVDAQSPQDPEDEKAAAIVLTFNVKDYRKASGFMYRGAFTKVKFTNDINLRLSLDEIDGQFAEGFKKVLQVLDKSGLTEIDAIKAFPYLDVVESLVGGLVDTFKGKNDSVWAERAHLWGKPAPMSGRAFLRNGIYAVVGRNPALLSAASSGGLTFKDGRLLEDGRPTVATYLLMSVAVDPAV
ncbi:hypothetical protein [Microbacterium sp. PRC9]|uniref:hypothetical protein n=1 Tax=Microbacterium sp. PRC9 TaxID=2962591 RepID=UPI002880DEEE|nr:hypothetical protein [Microbacterium sp. PRC9]MDT0142396.1 hypothetical protein [Microbacterium sp. PRC9]